jgi:hypothetical protein
LKSAGSCFAPSCVPTCRVAPMADRRIKNHTSWEHCRACGDCGYALLNHHPVEGAPCCYCECGDRAEGVWRSKPSRYGPLPTYAPDEVIWVDWEAA